LTKLKQTQIRGKKVSDHRTQSSPAAKITRSKHRVVQDLEKKGKKPTTAEIREYFRIKLKKDFFITLKVLDKIRERPTKDEKAEFNDLYNLVTTEDLTITAISNLRTNEGTSTAGIHKETLDKFSSENVRNLLDELKKGTFKWSAVRRVYIPKLGKK
jgi:hypothetical protein